MAATGNFNLKWDDRKLRNSIKEIRHALEAINNPVKNELGEILPHCPECDCYGGHFATCSQSQ